MFLPRNTFWTEVAKTHLTRCAISTLGKTQRYLVNKPLLAAGISEDIIIMSEASRLPEK